MCSAPSSSSALRKSSSLSLADETSQACARTADRRGRFLLTSAQTARAIRHPARRKDTFAPSRTKASTIARPNPWLPPVTIAFRFSSFINEGADGKVAHAVQRISPQVEKPIGVQNNWGLFHRLHERRPIRFLNLRPLGGDDCGVCMSQRIRHVLANFRGCQLSG